MLLTNTAEGGSNTTTVTVGNSGGGSGSAFDQVTIGTSSTVTFSSTQAVHGSLAYNFTSSGTSAASLVQWIASVTAGTTWYARIYVYLPALPATTLRLVKFADAAASPCALFDVSSAGKILARDASSTTVTTSTLAVSAGAWFRLEMKVLADASVGQTEVKIFKSQADNASPDEVNTSVATLNTRGTMGRLQWGPSLSIANANVFIDDLALSDSGYVGASGTPPAAGNFTGWGIPT